MTQMKMTQMKMTQIKMQGSLVRLLHETIGNHFAEFVDKSCSYKIDLQDV